MERNAADYINKLELPAPRTKPGAKTTEFWSQLGPYGMAAVLLYGVLDEETINLIKASCSALPDWAQALAALVVKVVTVVGGIIVSSKAVDVTQSYSEGRLSIKSQEITRSTEAARFTAAVQRAREARQTVSGAAGK